MKINVKTILRRSATIIGAILLTLALAIFATIAYLYCRFGNVRAVTPPASQHLAADRTDFTVAFFGDFAMQRDIFAPVLKQINKDRPDFAISVGDMFRTPRGGEGAYLIEMLRENLKIPFCAIPGNHDYARNGDLSAYMSAFGVRYYYFSYGDTLFVMLDDNIRSAPTPEILQSLPPEYWTMKRREVVGMDDAQIAWLDGILTKFGKDFRRCVLVMHQPPVTPEVLKEYTPEVIVGRQLEPIVARHKIDAIVSGHLHLSGKSDFKGIPVYHVPSCGQTMRDKVNRNFGYLSLHFAASGAIEPTPHYLPKLERGRNYFLNELVVEIPGNFRYYYFAWGFLVVGLGLLATARKLK